MTAPTPIDIGTLIHARPELHGGRPCLAGTGMMVHAIAALHRAGESAEAICAEFPDLAPGLIYAALAYYLVNRPAIDADLAADEALYRELAARYPNGWGPASVTGAAG